MSCVMAIIIYPRNCRSAVLIMLGFSTYAILVLHSASGNKGIYVQAERFIMRCEFFCPSQVV